MSIQKRKIGLVYWNSIGKSYKKITRLLAGDFVLFGVFLCPF